MLQRSVILQKAKEFGINPEGSPIEDILTVYRNALSTIERTLDTSDNSKITIEEINILEGDLRQIIATLHDLRDSLNTSLNASIKRNKGRNQLIGNSIKSLRTIERVKEKIRAALDELYTASDMFNAGKDRSFRKCFRDFKADLSEASSTFILLEIHDKEVSLNQTVIDFFSIGDKEQNQHQVSIIIGEDLKVESDSTTLSMKGSNYNSEAIRMLLTNCFDDSELMTFCYDHFREVYDKFTTTMDKTVKIQYLIDHCFRSLKIDNLLNKMEEKYPARYNQYRSSIVA